MAASAQWMPQAAAASTRGADSQQQGFLPVRSDMATSRMREQAVALIRDAKQQQELTAKVACLRQAMGVVLQGVPELLPELLQHVLEAQAAPGWRARAYLAEVVELVGFKFLRQVPSMLPALQVLLQDSSPGVVKNAIVAAAHLYGHTFEQLALQGIYSGQVDKWLVDVWGRLEKVKDAVFPAAFEHHSDVVRMHAVKFIEATVLLFSPDPSSSQPEGVTKQCNVAWIEAGHPVLAAGELGQEAVRSLELLLDQLRAPAVATLTSTLAIVLLNSLGNIAKRRPTLYGRIAPALIALAPRCEAVQVALVRSVVQILKTNLLGLLKCTHNASVPWREKIVAALREMDAGEIAESTLRQINRVQRNAERERMLQDRRAKDGRVQGSSIPRYILSPGRMGLTQENGYQAEGLEDHVTRPLLDTPELSTEPTRALQPEGRLLEQDERVPTFEVESSRAAELPNSQLSPEQQLINLIAAMLATQGEQAQESVKLVIDSLMPDQLADIFIANMVNLPATPPRMESVFSAKGNDPDPVGVLAEHNRSEAGPPSTPPGADALPSDAHLVDPQSAGGDQDCVQVSLGGLPASVEGTGSGAPVSVSETGVEVSGLSTSQDTGIMGGVEAIASGDSEAAPGGTIEAATVGTDTTRTPPIVLPRARFVPMRVEMEPVDTVSGQATMEEVGATSSGITESHTPTTTASPAPSVSQASAAEPLTNEVELERAGTALASVENEAQPGPSSVGSESTNPPLVLTDEQQARVCKTSVERIRESYKPISTGGGGELRIGLPAR